ncbi:MAG TPA: two-component system response regulator [Chloroflexi bacterium]|nr:two-component system response regulator [Chloroflexota bacterium]HBY07043.1 two-component system response regulator [Chloroflexota bacterium]
MERPTIPMPSKTILLVDDDQEARQSIAKTLQIENYTIIQAGDGIEALALIERANPDLIVSDLNMPNLDGIEFYKEIRRNLNWVTIPFIFLTGPNSLDKIRMGQELGVEDFLVKPINDDDLIRTIHGKLLRAAELEVAHIGMAYLETVKVIANAIEGRDRYTRGHVDRVTTYAIWLAEELRWPSDHLRILEFGARLHDIGKITVPDQILNKPDRLTEEEWGIMKRHPTVGAKILRDISHLQPAMPYILYHHERWDGTGYPEGLSGREIPIEARLLAIADVYDALTTNRPYHPAQNFKEVAELLKSESGKHFDPDLVPIFLNVLEKKQPHLR